MIDGSLLLSAVCVVCVQTVNQLQYSFSEPVQIQPAAGTLGSKACLSNYVVDSRHRRYWRGQERRLQTINYHSHTQNEDSSGVEMFGYAISSTSSNQKAQSFTFALLLLVVVTSWLRQWRRRCRHLVDGCRRRYEKKEKNE